MPFRLLDQVRAGIWNGTLQLEGQGGVREAPPLTYLPEPNTPSNRPDLSQRLLLKATRTTGPLVSDLTGSIYTVKTRN